MTCVEIDPRLAAFCEATLSSIPHRVWVSDALEFQSSGKYDRVIMNPPYKKMASADPHHQYLEVKTPNLYSSFMVAGLRQLKPHGECVAIVPRSWMNGTYFTKFRQWVLCEYSIDMIHVYDSRSEVFKDTNVLQETMLVKFSKRPQASQIIVTKSDASHRGQRESIYEADALISGNDCMIRIAPHTGYIDTRVSDVGFCPSTGKVVDFRARDRIYGSQNDAMGARVDMRDVYPLLYVGNFRSGTLCHPADIDKGQWYRADTPQSKGQLFAPGNYVVVKRFSSKEERRRVVAYPVEIDTPVAFENHSTILHSGTSRKVVPLASASLARGLALWLNSTFIDNWFRDISGSTQVNARDIKEMPCPPIDALLEFGKYWQVGMPQELIDAIVEQ